MDGKGAKADVKFTVQSEPIYATGFIIACDVDTQIGKTVNGRLNWEPSGTNQKGFEITSSDPSVAKLTVTSDESFTLEGLKEGSTNIHVSYKHKPGIFKNFKFTVHKDAPSIQWTCDWKTSYGSLTTDPMIPGETYQLKAAVNNIGSTGVTYAITSGSDYAARVNEALAAAEVDGTASESESVAGSSLNAAYKEWMMDAARHSGDITVVDAESGEGSYVVVFVSRNDNHYKTVNVRHILVNAVAGEDGTYSDEALETAKARAEEILAEWKSGDATEESFAALAEQYSEDGGSNTNGGLYENVAQGQMVEEFNDFLFARGRKSGDTGIVYGSNGNYAGYHVVYYVGEGEQYSDVIAKNALQSEAMTDWMTEITPEAVPAFFEKLAGK